MHLIIMGAPGSGKGTCAVDLKQIYGIPHISTGEMFRREMSLQTELGLLAKSYIDDGRLVPDEVTNAIVKERLKADDCANGFLLDGYPRTLVQAKEFDKNLKELNIKLDAAINLSIEDKDIIIRLTNRRSCTKCGAGYNLVTCPPKHNDVCDVCGSPLFQRADDNEETIANRLKVYNDQTKPLFDYYQSQDKVVNINSNQPIENVVSDIVKALEAKC